MQLPDLLRLYVIPCCAHKHLRQLSQGCRRPLRQRIEFARRICGECRNALGFAQQTLLKTPMGVYERTLLLLAFLLCCKQFVTLSLCIIALPRGICLLLLEIPALGQPLLLVHSDLQLIHAFAAGLFLRAPRIQLFCLTHMPVGQEDKFLLTCGIPPLAEGIIVLLKRFQLAFLRAQPLQITLEFLIGVEHLAQDVQLQIAREEDVLVDKIAHLIDGAKGERT